MITNKPFSLVIAVVALLTCTSARAQGTRTTQVAQDCLAVLGISYLFDVPGSTMGIYLDNVKKIVENGQPDQPKAGVAKDHWLQIMNRQVVCTGSCQSTFSFFVLQSRAYWKNGKLNDETVEHAMNRLSKLPQPAVSAWSDATREFHGPDNLRTRVVGFLIQIDGLFDSTDEFNFQNSAAMLKRLAAIPRDELRAASKSCDMQQMAFAMASRNTQRPR